MTDNHKNHFNFALIAILLSMSASLLAFYSEGSKITGFATGAGSEVNHNFVDRSSLPEFNNVKSLGTLGTGKYYVDSDGIVYWLDDESKPAVARLRFTDESQKNMALYIDKDGNVGYLLQ